MLRVPQAQLALLRTVSGRYRASSRRLCSLSNYRIASTPLRRGVPPSLRAHTPAFSSFSLYSTRDETTSRSVISSSFFHTSSVQRSDDADVEGVEGTLSSLKHVCIVGTGPSGFYAAKYLLKAHPTVRIDLIERLPTPFGLVRSGVAPDHPEVKSVQNDFEEVAKDPRLNFVGNLNVGTDISIEELKRFYNAVLFAYGAADDRWLGVPGEDLSNVLSARSFVNWYNAHPDYRDLQFDLDGETAVVIGQGNVAIDCARILAKGGEGGEELETTDIAQHALEKLKKSKIRNVLVVGRRGHVQAAFTMKELREVTRLKKTKCVVLPQELQAGLNSSSQEEIDNARAKKRIDQLLSTVAKDYEKNSNADKQLQIRFLLSPKEILESESKKGSVGAILLERNSLDGEAFSQRATGTGEVIKVDCSLVLRSIGYKSQPMDDIPFDSRRMVLSNELGRIVDQETKERVPGFYCAGWVKRGPSGIIGTNIQDSKETVAALMEDAKNGAVPSLATEEGGLNLLLSYLEEHGKQDYVLWDDYMKIDDFERKEGEKIGKPREKLTNVSTMLEIAGKDESNSSSSSLGEAESQYL